MSTKRHKNVKMMKNIHLFTAIGIVSKLDIRHLLKWSYLVYEYF